MAEKDAFGNDIGSGSSTPTPVPGPTPAGVPTWTPPPDIPGSGDAAEAPPPPPPAPAWTPPPTSAAPSNLPPVRLSNASANRAVGGGRGRSPIAVIITLVAAALIIGLPLKLAFDSGNKAIDEVNKAINQVTSNPSSPSSSSASPSSPSTPAKEPVGVGTGSLVRPFAVAKFVRTRIPGKGKLVMLRVSPANLQAQTHTSVGSLHVLYSDYKGLNTDTKSPTGGFGSQPAIPLSKIDAQAPMRMVKHIPRHSAGINYVLLEPFDGDLKWLAYYKNSNHFYSADLHGRHIQQIG